MFEQERIFTRLLAKEDISVVSSATAKTASFDVVSRVITFPVYKDMQKINLTGFTCHEVGHALHTDTEVMKLSTRFGHSVVNVLEDLRCNNLMKSEFRGISNIFYDHYNSLEKRGFFGDTKDYSMGFLDKINVANKMRINLFQSTEEIGFWKEFSNMETVDELIAACEYVVNFYKDEQKVPESDSGGFDGSNYERIENEDDESEEDEESAGGIIIPNDEDADEGDSNESDGNDSEFDPSDLDEDSDSDEESDEDSDSEGSGGSGDDDEESDEDSDSDGSGDDDEESDEDSDSDGSGDEESDGADDSDEDSDGSGGEDSDEESDEESDEDSDSEGSGSDGGSGSDSKNSKPDDNFDPNSIKSESEEEFEKNLSESVTPTRDRPKSTYVVPRTRDLTSNVIRYNEVRNNVGTGHESEWNGLKGSQKKIVNRMVATFNRNKSASEFHRRKFSESGSLNMNRLHSYRTSDDIFLKNMRVQEGKNHGVMFYLDTSWSMIGASGIYTIKQLSLMTEFCRKLSIPYSVMSYEYNNIGKNIDKKESKTSLSTDVWNIEVLNSAQSNEAHEKMLLALYTMMRGSYSGIYYDDDTGYSRELMPSGTPLWASMLNSINYISEFKAKNNVQIMNVMYFTDGDNGTSLKDGRNTYVRMDSKIMCAETKKTYELSDYTDTAFQNGSILLSNLVADRLNCNVFFLQVPEYASRVARMMGVSYYDRAGKSAMTRKFKKETFIKVDQNKNSKVDHYLLYDGISDGEEKNFDMVDIETDSRGKVNAKSLNALRKVMKNSNASIKGASLFASLVAEKIASGF